MNWATDTSQSSAYLTYGIAGQEACTAHSAAAVGAQVPVGSLTEYLWRASFPVSPDTLYCYRVFLGGGGSAVDLLGSASSPTFHSQVPAGATTPYSFAVIGDWGSVDSTGANPDQANLLAHLAGSGARFAVSVGDIGYPSGSQANYGDLVQVGSNLSGVFGPSFWTVPGQSIPFFPAIGNHGFARNDTYHPQLFDFPEDTAVASSGGTYTRQVYCCQDGTSSANDPSAWYAFDVGSARIYILEAAWSNSNVGTASMYQVDHDYHWTISSPEYQWLQADLAAHTSQLKFAVFHFPLYSDNSTEVSDTYLQGPDSLEGLLGAYKVAIAFTGHAHIYQRNNAAPGGLISYVAGGGGAPLEPVSKCSAIDAYAIGWSYSSSSGSACGAAPKPTSASQVFSYLLVSVNGRQVTVTPTDENGNTFDVQTYDFSTSDSTPPSVPQGVSASATSPATVSVSWQAATDDVGVAGYTVYRDGVQVGTTSAAQLSYADTGLTPSTAYTYTVDAFDAAGNHSAQSSAVLVTTQADTTPPSVPTGVTATALGSTSIGVSWQPSTDDVGVAGYTIYRDGSVAAIVDGGSTSYTDVSVSPSTTYSYTVDAFDAAGNHSAQSSPASATTPSAATLIFSDGFESGNLSAWSSSKGLVVESTNVHGGTYAAEGNTTNGATYAKKTLPSTYTTLHASVWFDITSGSSQVNLLRVRDASGTSIGYLYVNLVDATLPGRLGLRDDAGALTFTSSVVPGPGWHQLELTLTIAGTSSTYAVALDGALVGQLTGTANWGTAPIGQYQIGEVQTGRTYDVIFDDTEVDIPGS